MKRTCFDMVMYSGMTFSCLPKHLLARLEGSRPGGRSASVMVDDFIPSVNQVVEILALDRCG